MKQLSLHVLELCINSIDAGASEVNVEIENSVDCTTLIVKDNGNGMSDSLIRDCLNKGVSTKGSGGFGLYELYKDAKSTNGDVSITSNEGRGSKIIATFLTDMQFVGIGDSIAVVLDDKVNVTLKVTKTARIFTFDTRTVKNELNGVSIQTPSVIVAIKKHINEKILKLEEQSYEEHRRHHGN